MAEGHANSSGEGITTATSTVIQLPPHNIEFAAVIRCGIKAHACTHPTPIFRFVHVDNLEVTLRRDVLHAPNHTPNDELSFQTIHNTEIQEKRKQPTIPCGPGGVIHDYVPFYFGYLSPMMLQLNTAKRPDTTKAKSRSFISLGGPGSPRQWSGLRLLRWPRHCRFYGLV